MAQLTLLNGGYKPKPKPDYKSLYENAFYRKIDEFKEKQDWQLSNQIVFYGVKYLNLIREDCNTREKLEAWLRFSGIIKSMMGLITPTELIQIFPITKDFDGSRWECKDYFYTMEKLREHGLDEPIGEAIEELLWDYMNPHTRNFTVNILSIVDDLRRLDGEKGMFEEFAEQNGITMYRKYKDQKGREYMVNGDTGETCRITKKKPRYLRAVKGCHEKV